MDNPGLPDNLWNELDGGLWHATNKSGVSGIVETQKIRVSSANRYTNSFCRCMGAVSLFDFGTNSRSDDLQFTNWSGWFGYQQDEPFAIWLRIDRDLVGEKLLDAGRAGDKWKLDRQNSVPHGVMIIGGVEACHRGPVPISSINAMMLIARYDQQTFQVFHSDWTNCLDEIGRFESSLPPSRGYGDNGS